MAELLQFALDLRSAIPDAAERELALDITRSFIVEAPAGSGKTGLLIQRFLKLLASQSVTDPAQILAITFTRKATHEMRDRVLQQLAAAQHSAPATGDFDRETRAYAKEVLARDRQLDWRLLDHPERLNIATIDAVCAQIARSLPVLTGGAAQSPTEESAPLYAEAARRTLAHLGGDDPALAAALELLLLHRDGNLADCETLISEMLAWRDQWGDLIPLTGDQLTEEFLETVTLPRLNKALDQAICRGLTRVARLMPPAILERLSSLASEMATAEGYKGAPSPIALCSSRNQPPRERAEDLEHWAALARLLVKPSKPRSWRKAVSANIVGFEILKHHQAELKSIIAELDSLANSTPLFEALCSLTNLPPAEYPAEQWLVAKALFRVLSRALIELQLVFATRSQCDFTEFSLLARTALRESQALDDLAASTGFRLQHLLVDEMQDTSNSQYELIHLLTQHWDGHSQTVFLVGDPKQSIYLFRQARVERFLDTLRTGRLGDLPLTPLYLTANFRSQATLVSSFNTTFTPIFPDAPESLFAVPYRAAWASRDPAPGPHIEWHTAVLPYTSNRELRADARRRQSRKNAAAIRRLVESWRARPLPRDRKDPWKIAVLVRSRKDLLEIVRAFKSGATPIPFRAVKTEPLGERQEVLDLLALTRALLHPGDRTAWLALLRTPWCGLTLRDLHTLAGEDAAFSSESPVLSLIQQRGELLSPDGIARLEAFYTVLSAALAERSRLALSQWVERTWRAFAADRFASPAELVNTQRFLELLDELEAQPGPFSTTRLEQRIATLFAAESTTPGAVDFMTIHNAKGLEWDFVVVPALESSSGKNGNRLLSWIELEADHEGDELAHGIVAPVQPKGSEAFALNKWMNAVRYAREAAERKRLFYVACTRAREELHLFAAPELTAKGELSPRFDSLLRAAWPAAEDIFAGSPLPVASEEPQLFEIAAAASLSLVPPPEPLPERTIQRIPISAFPQASLQPLTNPGAPAPALSLSNGLASETWAPHSFPRPEGSFEARIFGNATHAFLELLATRIAAGANPASLLTEVPTWHPRIAAILRANGLAPAEIPRAASNVQRALTRTLEDPIGQWLLAAHPEASSETSIVSAGETIRLDRTFLAGPGPQTTGSTHLWIIDYKTGSHAAENLDAFLAREREKYAPQLEHYAQQLTPRGLPIRLALYFPALARLLWWPAANN
jgi:ATP-dependent helicase/nuclease subunit A